MKPRFFFRQFASVSLAALHIMVASLIASSTTSAAVLGTLYDHGKVYAKILEIGPLLGEGAIGTVHKVYIQRPGHEPEWVALKSFDPSKGHSDELIRDYVSGWERLGNIPESERGTVLGQAKLFDLPQVRSESLFKGTVVIEPLAAGSAADPYMRESLKLSLDTPNAEQRLRVIHRFKDEMLHALQILAAHKYVHGDVKPSNILFRTDSGFFWDRPEASKIHFQLSDYDTLSVGGTLWQTGSTQYLPPEILTERELRNRTSGDLYSLAVSTYELLMNDEPAWHYFFDNPKIFHRLRHKDFPHRDETRQLFIQHLKLSEDHADQLTALYALAHNPKDYDSYLHWVDQKLKNRAQYLPAGNSAQLLNELREFIMGGLAYNPKARLPLLHGKSCLVSTVSESFE